MLTTYIYFRLWGDDRHGIFGDEGNSSWRVGENGKLL